MYRRLLLLALLAATTTIGCGKKGDPLPPLRNIPARTEDLVVSQKGGELVLRMGFPATTADGRPLSGIDAVEIWELAVPGVTDAAAGPGIDAELFSRQATKRLVLRGAELQAMTIGSQLVARLLAPAATAPRLLVLGIRTVAAGGEASAYSNLARLVLRTPPAAPSNLAATPVASGIDLSWQSAAAPAATPAGYRVYRRLATERGYGAPVVELPADARGWRDEAARYDQRYIYTVSSVGSREPLIEGPIAAEVEVDYADRFAPTAPTRLLALPEPGRTRLVWDPSTSKDTASYRVWRLDPRAEWRVVAEGLETSEYVDAGLTPGLAYSYRVEAVDQRGNIGPASPEAQVTIP